MVMYAKSNEKIKIKNITKLQTRSDFMLKSKKFSLRKYPRHTSQAGSTSSVLTAALGRGHLEDWCSNNPSGSLGHHCLWSPEGFAAPKHKFFSMAACSNETCLPGDDL